MGGWEQIGRDDASDAPCPRPPMKPDDAKTRFLKDLGRPWICEELFDVLTDSVVFIKDRQGRYVVVNQTLVERCGMKSKDEVIGKSAREVFPAPLGESFSEQDMEVIEKSKAILAQLELHLYPGGRRGWCLTWKEPVLNAKGETVGVSGISRDLLSSLDAPKDMDAISGVLSHIEKNLDEPLRLQELADKAGLSTYQLDQRIRALFNLTAGQYITRKRIERACHLLERTSSPITDVALDCGYGDQSAFTRQFRQSVGITPGAFREQRRSGS